MFNRYKEIWFGFGLGLSMWVLDAMMHVAMRGNFGWQLFLQDLVDNNITQLFFRSLFIIISMAFGFALWLSNKHKNRANDLRDTINNVHSEIASPLMLIVGYSKLLSLKEGWPVSREEVELLREIQLNAEKINNAINRFPPPGTPLFDVEVAGVMADQSKNRRSDD